MKRDIYYKMGPTLRRIVRRAYYLPVDFYESLTGKRNKLTPPKGRIFIGSGDFTKQGNNILEQMIKLGGLKPNNRVLDVGCGIGRVAVPLAKYLNPEGSYEGFDIVKSGINWCRKHISPSYPNFNFKHIDLKNELYNLKTNREAKEFIFPYHDGEFDFVFLTSVFTHMLPEDVVGYLNQIFRVTKKGGTCFCTFFIINEESKHLMNSFDGIHFNLNYGNYYLHNINVKEANVAYDENYLTHLTETTGFKTDKKHYGYWSGRAQNKSVDFQDILVLKK